MWVPHPGGISPDEVKIGNKGKWDSKIMPPETGVGDWWSFPSQQEEWGLIWTKGEAQVRGQPDPGSRIFLAPWFKCSARIGMQVCTLDITDDVEAMW